MDELKACPFCGGEVRIVHDLDATPTGVMCRECGALFLFTGIQPVKKNENFARAINEITERWNKRT